MARLTRTELKIFAGSANANPNVGQFGSLAAGSPTYTKDLTAIQALSRYSEGWLSATVGDKSPAIQDRNALDYLMTSFLAYLLQAGIPEWLSTQTYYTGQFAASASGVLYRSKTNNNVGNALTDSNNWENYVQAITPPATTCKAWVCFDGTGTIGAPCNLYSSYNVSQVVKEDTGTYLVYFSSALSNNNYSFSGSCGTPDGLVAIPGDNNIVCGGKPGETAVKLTSSFRIYTWEPNANVTEDSRSVSVQVFGL